MLIVLWNFILYIENWQQNFTSKAYVILESIFL